jgi:DNA topoisomerase-1
LAKALVVVESPAKAKTINKYLGRDFKVVASMGHVRDLPKSKLGVDVESGFEPEYVVIPARSKVIKELKEAAKQAEDIFVATDQTGRARRSAGTWPRSWAPRRRSAA